MIRLSLRFTISLFLCIADQRAKNRGHSCALNYGSYHPLKLQTYQVSNGMSLMFCKSYSCFHTQMHKSHSPFNACQCLHQTTPVYKCFIQRNIGQMLQLSMTKGAIIQNKFCTIIQVATCMQHREAPKQLSGLFIVSSSVGTKIGTIELAP